MEFLDATILTTALPAMAREPRRRAARPQRRRVDLRADAGDLHPAERLGGGAFRRPGGVTAAIALFTLSSALCGLSTTPWFFIAARALQGVGGAFMVPVGRLVVLRTTPPSGILRATALLTWPALTAPLIGPPLGGFLAQHWSWRAIFYVNLPLGLVGAVPRLGLDPGAGERAGRNRSTRRLRLGAVALGAALLAIDAEGGARGGAGAARRRRRAMASGAMCAAPRTRSSISAVPPPRAFA